MTRLSAFRTSVHHHLIIYINNKLWKHNLYASNFNYVKFSIAVSREEEKEKRSKFLAEWRSHEKVL